MRTAGVILKEAREAKRRTLSQISRRTRIKERFLQALESSDWQSLPNFTVALGFARVYAQNVGVDPNLVVALLKRDFPEARVAQIGEGVLLRPRAIWTPKTTITVTVVICLVLLTLYLGNQYLQFAAPPPLSVSVSDSDSGIKVVGKTSPSATVEVNGSQVLVEQDGSFNAQVERQNLINSSVYVEAVSRTGKKTIVTKEVGSKK